MRDWIWVIFESFSSLLDLFQASERPKNARFLPKNASFRPFFGFKVHGNKVRYLPGTCQCTCQASRHFPGTQKVTFWPQKGQKRTRFYPTLTFLVKFPVKFLPLLAVIIGITDEIISFISIQSNTFDSGPSQSNFQSIWINFKSFLTIFRPILGPVFHIALLWFLESRTK